MVNFVVLIGPDGIGKSSTSKELKIKLEASQKYSKVRIYHHRPEILPNLSRIFTLSSRNSNYKTNQEPTSKKNQKIVGINTLKVAYYCFDYMFVYFQLLRAKIFNELVIYDRYVYDYSIQKHHLKNTKSVIIAILYKILPKPDKIVFIYSNPKVVIARKNELSLSEHNDQNARCIGLLKLFRDKAIAIHTTSNIDITSEKIMQSIF